MMTYVSNPILILLTIMISNRSCTSLTLILYNSHADVLSILLRGQSTFKDCKNLF